MNRYIRSNFTSGLYRRDILIFKTLHNNGIFTTSNIKKKHWGIFFTLANGIRESLNPDAESSTDTNFFWGGGHTGNYFV